MDAEPVQMVAGAGKQWSSPLRDQAPPEQLFAFWEATGIKKLMDTAVQPLKAATGAQFSSGIKSFFFDLCSSAQEKAGVFLLFLHSILLYNTILRALIMTSMNACYSLKPSLPL